MQMRGSILIILITSRLIKSMTLKKIRIAAKGKISVINNHASDEQIILSFYRTVPTDCEVCVTIQPLSYCQSLSADSCREKW